MHQKHPRAGGKSLVRFLSIVAVVICTLVPTTVLAQKVMTVPGQPVTIQFLAGDQKVADRVSAITAEAIPRLSMELGLDRVFPLRVYLISDMEAFQREQGVRLPEWGVAFALMENQVMLVDVKRATNAWNSLRKVIPHELSHLLVAQRVGDVRLPVWFVEGLALWQAGEWSLLENWRLMEAVWTRRAPGLAQVHRTLPAEKTKAHDAYRVAYMGFTERFDSQMDRLPVFLDEVAGAADFGTAFQTFWGESESEYYTRFGESLRKKYRSRLLLFQTGPLFTIVGVLFLIVVLRVRIRNRKKLKRMEQIDRGLSLDDS